MTTRVTLEASCVAAGIAAVEAHEFEPGGTILRLVERGQVEPWAVLEVGDIAQTRSIFPVYRDERQGDSNRRRGHMGAWWTRGGENSAHTLRVLLNRSARMIRDRERAEGIAS